MDQRQTLNANENFKDLLQKHKENGEEVRIIFDDSGMERAQGNIEKIESETGRGFIVLNTGETIFIDSIIGVNGIFKDDYTEC